MSTLLHIEVANRLVKLSDAERVHPVLDVMRVTAQVTRELERRGPESVDAFLSQFPTPVIN